MRQEITYQARNFGPVEDNSLITFATRAAIYRSLRALRARNCKKISKKVFSGVCRKVPKNTRKSLKIPIFGPFWAFLDFFRYFLGLFCRPPKRPFLRFFCDFGPGGPRDSCKWRLGPQDNLHKNVLEGGPSNRTLEKEDRAQPKTISPRRTAQGKHHEAVVDYAIQEGEVMF